MIMVFNVTSINAVIAYKIIIISNLVQNIHLSE